MPLVVRRHPQRPAIWEGGWPTWRAARGDVLQALRFGVVVAARCAACSGCGWLGEALPAWPGSGRRPQLVPVVCRCCHGLGRVPQATTRPLGGRA